MKSDAYLISAFNFVHHNWAKNMDIDKVERILREVKSLIEKRATDIQFKRVYIPKACGTKYRPLGVPSPA
jgi:retron-type reverse transcriptase